jgi:hypothetical protein
VGKNVGVYREITTLNYGFNLSMTGRLSLNPLQSVPYQNNFWANWWLKK